MRTPLAAILAGTLIIAIALSLGVYQVFGEEPGYYFSLFIALPAGLGISGLIYLIYTAVTHKRE